MLAKASTFTGTDNRLKHTTENIWIYVAPVKLAWRLDKQVASFFIELWNNCKISKQPTINIGKAAK